MKDEKEVRRQAKLVAARFGKNYDERQDIEGRCLEAAWKAEPKLKSDYDPSNYIIKTMENAAKSYLRSKKIVDLPLLEEMAELIPNSDYDSFINDLETSETVIEFISQLSETDRKIVEMLLSGADYEEIAEALDISVVLVRTKISRGRKKWKGVFNSI